eukprot:TRINITY_DN33457_c0_g2_i1.p1 TRINITY_DN33457_c0_g2~~TRINITY_DN33457_c0_g2_i1.p1  ORF type:complete len:472 (+),score=95.11 TRINITY_DN33457_c0_g2_i1:27-1418(+)
MESTCTALQLRPASRTRLRLGAVLLRLAACRRLAAKEALQAPLDCEEEQLLKALSQAEDVACLLEEILKSMESHGSSVPPIVLEDQPESECSRSHLEQEGRPSETESGNEEAPQSWLGSPVESAKSLARRSVGRAASTLGSYAAKAGQAGALNTCRAAAFGLRRSAATTWKLARPPLTQALSYVVTPSGFLTSASTLAACGSVQLASLAAASSAAAVGASAASAALQTSAELIQQGCRAPGADSGSSLEVLRRALRDPDYARQLEDMLRAERASTVTRRQKLLRRAKTWASLVNTGLVAKVAPRVSDVVSRRMLSNQPIGLEAFRQALGAGAGALDDLLVGQRSALLETTKLTLATSTWFNTKAHAKVDLLRSSSGRSVECIASVARRVAEYRALGPREGCRAVSRDVLNSVTSSLFTEGPAAAAVERVGSIVGRPLSFVGRWMPATPATPGDSEELAAASFD